MAQLHNNCLASSKYGTAITSLTESKVSIVFRLVEVFERIRLPQTFNHWIPATPAQLRRILLPQTFLTSATSAVLTEPCSTFSVRHATIPVLLTAQAELVKCSKDARLQRPEDEAAETCIETSPKYRAFRCLRLCLRAKIDTASSWVCHFREFVILHKSDRFGDKRRNAG